MKSRGEVLWRKISCLIPYMFPGLTGLEPPEVWSTCKCGGIAEGTPQDLEQWHCRDCGRIGCYVLDESDT